MRELLQLFWSFCCIGGLTFGGGYAMLPMIQKEIVDKRGWASEQEVMDYYAVGQCTPGVIAVNTATFVGYKRRGVPGAIVATFGVIFPSMVIITVIAAFIQNFTHLEVVQNAFAGVRVAVVALIVQAIAKLWKNSIVDIFTTALCVVAFLLVVLLNISPIFVVLGAGVIGLAYGLIRRKKA